MPVLHPGILLRVVVFRQAAISFLALAGKYHGSSLKYFSPLAIKNSLTLVLSLSILNVNHIFAGFFAGFIAIMASRS